VSDAGKLHLRVLWDGAVLRDAAVTSTRVQASRLLQKKSPQAAVQLLPLLFSVCGKAQRAAALAAVTAAQGKPLAQVAQLERALICEAMQEHLWRLLLDWPKLLGLPQQQAQFVRWHAALNAVAAGQGDAAILRAELHLHLLGMTEAEWRQCDSYERLRKWMRAGRGLCAPVFAALEQKESALEFAHTAEACPFLPELSAAAAMQTYAGHLDHHFAARPLHEGRSMETGALAYRQHEPLLLDVQRKYPTRLSARLLARLLDVLDGIAALAQENTAGYVQGILPGDGVGLSVVRTARGMLLHQVNIDMERVAEYLIVAPTEWNFHPQGSLVKGLLGLQENDEERLMETIKLYVLSLDPCVEYEIEVQRA
jgi:hypothetical protein